MRIGKCKICKKEMHSTAIFNDNIIEIGCENGHYKEVAIILKRKRELLKKFEKEINKRKKNG